METTSLIADYLDEETSLIKAANGGRDNLVLFTAELIALLPDFATQTLVNTVQAYLIKYDVGGGCFKRNPESNDNSVDNMIGACFVSQRYAEEVLKYGRESNWIFNTAEPKNEDLDYWYGRFIGFPPFVKVAAGQPLWIGDQILFAVACLYSSRSEYGNTSDKILQWLINRTVYGKHRFTDWAIDSWRASMQKKYPGGMKEVMAIYHGKDHPFTAYAGSDFK